MLKSVLILLKGTAFAQIIGFLLLPIISRIFSDEIFGQFQAFQAIISLVFVVVMLRYEVAILRATDDEINSVVALCGLLTIFTTSILTAFFLILDESLIENSFFELNFGWWWISISAFIIGFSQILLYLATRDSLFSDISNAKIAQGLSSAALTLCLALLSPLSISLILGDIFGRITNGFWLARKRYATFCAAAGSTASDIWTAASRFRDLSMISLPGALLGTAGSVMTPLLIYANFNAATAGQFGLVERAAGLPLAMIVGVISQVHMGNLAQDIRDKTDLARQSYIRLTVLLATIALPPAILCFIFAPQLFVILFGPGWDQAAQFARLLAPAYFVGLVTGGLNMTLTVMGNQKTQIGWDFSRFCCMVLLWTFAPSAGWTINTIVLFHSILLSAFSLIQFYLCFRVLPRMSSRRSDPLGQ